MSAVARVLFLTVLPMACAQTRIVAPAVMLHVHMESAGDVIIRATVLRAELHLAPALAAVIHCPAGTMSGEDQFGEFRCHQALRRDGLSLEGSFDLAPVAQKLAATDEIQLWLEYPRLGFETSSMPLEGEGSLFNRVRTARFAAGAVPASIRIQFGYRADQLTAIYLPLAAMALALTLIMISLARAGHPELSRSVFLLSTMLWLGAATRLQAGDPLRILLSGTPLANIAAALVEYCPPLLCVAAGVAWGSRKRADRPRGAMFAEVLWGFGMFLFPLASALGAVPSMAEGDWVRVAPWLVFAPISVIVCRWRIRANAGSTVRQLSGGELKDRISQLAARTGHDVQVYLASSTRSQVFNAFAMRRHGIVLTAPLIQSLTRREVDAVAAHEISHLGHVRRSPWAALAISAVLFQTPVGVLLFPSAGAFLVAMLAPAMVYLAALRGTRKREFAADAGSAALTGDPRAMISALARIARHNRQPLELKPMVEWFSTHPSTRKRIDALAAAGRVEAAELEILCSQDDPGGPYPPPPDDSGAIFTPAWQRINGQRYVWTALLGASGAGLLVAWLLEKSLGAGVAQLAGGIILGCAITKVLASTAVSYSCARLRRKLASKLGAGGQLVGLAVDSEPRVYNGFRCSEAGFLLFQDGRLCFRGEQTTIQLNPADVVDVSMLAAAPASWRRMQPMVRFRDPESGSVKAFILHPMGWGATPRRLLHSIERWRATQTSAERTSISGLHPITGQPYRPPTIAQVARAFRIPGAVTLVGTVLAGWFVRPEWWPAWYALIITACAYTFMYLPAMLYRPPSPAPMLTPRAGTE
jgi:heat shock protein HtpX